MTTGGRSGRSVAFRDENFAGRLGWKEVVVRADRGAKLLSSTAPRESVSNELRSYPKDLLQEPASSTSARATLSPGTLPGIMGRGARGGKRRAH